jgi:predicted ATPase
MAFPVRPRRVGGWHLVNEDGSNLAEFIELLYGAYPQVFAGIIETLQFILPYVEDLRPVVTSDVGRNVFLLLKENGFQLPSWLFSTGTLRLLALLVILRSPIPVPLIAIEEIENGLDPRSICLIVDEIREVVRTGRSQVIITTHSPYLLDLVPLESIVFVERIEGEPRFFRPQDSESVQRWSEEFAPGRLYTMGRFRHES